MDGASSVRRLIASDAAQALVLYNELTKGPQADSAAGFFNVLSHQGTDVYGAFDGEALAAMVTLHLLPNALWSARPYGLIENVVTRASHQRRGFGRMALSAALAAAQDAGAYKVMLLTGTARGAVGFYEALGFSGSEKHGMILRFP